MDKREEDNVKRTLNALEYVSVEELDNRIYDDLDDEQIDVLNKRMKEYESNPDQSTISLSDFKQHIKVKYGLLR